MIDAYEIGITLALQNGVSEGLAAVRRDLGALDQAIAATAVGLARLQAMATSAGAGSEAELRRVSAAAAVAARPVPSPGAAGPVLEPATAPARAAARIVDRESAPTARLPTDDVVRPGSAQTMMPVAMVSAPLVIPAASTPAAAPVSEAPRVTAAQLAEQPSRSERAVAPEPRVAARIPTPSVVEPRILVAVAPPAVPAAPAALVSPPGARSQVSRVVPRISAPPAVVPAPPAADLAAFARTMSPVVRGEVALPAGVHSRPGEVFGDGVREGRTEWRAAPVARPETWPEVKRRAMAPVATVAEASMSERAAQRPAAERVPTTEQHHSPAGGPTHGDVFLDGTLVGRWMANQMTRDADRPPSGPTGFDARRSAAWPGATVGP